MMEKDFSEFEIVEQHIKVKGSESYKNMSCVGSSEEELEVKTVQKKCRGLVVKEKTKSTGRGTLNEKVHVPYDVYNDIYGMNRINYVDGVNAYGQDSTHPEFSLTQKVINEEDEVKLKAYPRCVLNSGPKRPVENGQEEVPELELGITLLPDENGECMYQALESELDTEIAKKWLTEFTPELIKIQTV